MRFEDAYTSWQDRRLTQEEAARLLGVCERKVLMLLIVLCGWLLDIGLPGIALAGWGRPADKRQVRQADFDVHFTNPADFNQLQAWIAGRTAHCAAADVAPEPFRPSAR
jgi:hypothetical protein